MQEQTNCFSVVWRTSSKEFQEQKSNKRQQDPEETSPTSMENHWFKVIQIDSNKNKKFISFKSKENIHEKGRRLAKPRFRL